MQYRAETTSLVGFVQQIACCYLRHGYWWYVTGYIPDRKDPELVDRKLITKYEIDVSESTRSRRKRLGRANLVNHSGRDNAAVRSRGSQDSSDRTPVLVLKRSRSMPNCCSMRA